MYKKFYTTAMCPQRKIIERRFKYIRSTSSVKKYMSVMGIIMSVILLSVTVLVGGVLAGVVNGSDNVTINGKNYDMKLIHIDNERYLHTKSWYVPLRDVFEALDCTINYNVGHEKTQSVYRLQSFPQYEWRENLVTDDITSQIYGATTLFNDTMPVIEIISPEGKTLYCQIGSEFYTPFGSCPPPVLINGKAYASIALIDGFITQNS
ncbi:MAG: hypothetical protein PHE51_12795, partial [Eubacteriales bacterium]|nr:hypothetical protein [Eubacteriales bacterium]